MGLETSAVIRGKSYTKGSTFSAISDFWGKSSSAGATPNSFVTKGDTYSFLYYYPGMDYPYAIGTRRDTNVRCWVKADIFPYASYTVSYNANGGSGAPGSQSKVYGSTLTLSSSKPTRTGYTFSRWNTKADGSGTSYYPGEGYTANAAVALYAIWTADVYTISYHANGGSGAPANQSKTHGINTTLSSTKPTRTGYTFQKWNTRANGTGTSYNAGSTYSANASVTLYAVWSANVYLVRFEANGGTGSMVGQEFYYGSAQYLRKNIYSRTGYTFQKWNTKADGTGMSYTDGQSVNNLNANSGTVTLYAIWTANAYTVKFNANGGNGSMTAISCTYGIAQKLPKCTMSRIGHTFVGWAKDVNAAQAQYTDQQSVTNLTATQGGAVTMYAVWSINSVTITFDASANGGSVTPTTMEVNYGGSIPNLPEAVRPYYVFIGWFTAKTGGTKIANSTIFTQPTTLYAQFVIDASIHIKVGSVWKKGIPYVKIDGVWNKGYIWCKAKGTWKQGIG
ncbi:MAG: InlB B-repeat-containing protein [Oscillospiraceae bacterium]|nr:InlB B-repeat-containing protein [Oscillospiraceae bacterium]